MPPVLLAPVNVSCGRDAAAIAAIGGVYEAAGAVVLDVHSDPDHDRTVHTLAAVQGELAGAVLEGARKAVELIDLTTNDGVHPRVGAVDVAPVVNVRAADRGAACAEALRLAAMLGDEAGLPVFLYGKLAGGRSRAEIRSGGTAGLRDRVEQGLVSPDFGPREISLRSGAVLVGSRPPMIAFNLVLAERVGIDEARRAAAMLREGGENGLAGARVLAFELERGGVVQLSANLELPDEVGIAEFHEAASALVPVSHGELIGLAPRSVIDRIPADLPMPGLDPVLRSVEGCLRFHRLIS